MNIHAIILAAGQGTRLQDKYIFPKPLLPLAGKPATLYVLENLEALGIPATVVIKHEQEKIRAALGGRFFYVEQGEKGGTGGAFASALPVGGKKAEHIVVFNADDSAFLEKRTIENFLSTHGKEENVATVMTVKKDDPSGLGRIIRKNENVMAIVEEKDASPEEKLVKEVNTGVFCFNSDWVKEAARGLTPNPVTGEYYITDLINIAVEEGKKIGAFLLDDGRQWFGFNTPEQYEKANRLMESRLLGD